MGELGKCKSCGKPLKTEDFRTEMLRQINAEISSHKDKGMVSYVDGLKFSRKIFTSNPHTEESNPIITGESKDNATNELKDALGNIA